MSLGAALDEALLVRFDPNTGLTLAWFGNEHIRAFNPQGEEVSAWSSGASDFNTPGFDNRAVARRSMETHIQEGYYPY